MGKFQYVISPDDIKIGKISIPEIRLSPIKRETNLFQNYPNPFNSDTWLPYQLARKTPVTIKIYNSKGQLIRTLNLGEQKAGFYVTKNKAAYWDGRDNAAENVASGVYFYTLRVGHFTATRKMAIFTLFI